MDLNKYHNSKIYKLTSIHTDKIYIGSTIQKYLTTRKGGHIASYKKFQITNSRTDYLTSFILIELGDIDIVLLEAFKCNDVNELHQKEKYYIDLYKDICVNKNPPCIIGRSSLKYYYDNKDIVKDKNKEYYEKNKEILKQKALDKNKNKEYYEKNKEILKQKALEKKRLKKENLNFD